MRLLYTANIKGQRSDQDECDPPPHRRTARRLRRWWRRSLASTGADGSIPVPGRTSPGARAASGDNRRSSAGPYTSSQSCPSTDPCGVTSARPGSGGAYTPTCIAATCTSPCPDAGWQLHHR